MHLQEDFCDHSSLSVPLRALRAVIELMRVRAALCCWCFQPLSGAGEKGRGVPHGGR